MESKNEFLGTPEKNFKALGLDLPPAPKPMGVYKPGLKVDHFYYVSGHGPVLNDGSLIVGRVGDAMDMEEGKLAAQQVGLTILSTLKSQLGSLDKIKRVIKVLGMVNCTSDYTAQPAVINGFSDLMVAVFGEKGKHARSAVGVGSLPNNMAVEIEVIVELEDK